MAIIDPALTARISTEARDVHFGRTVLTILATLLFGLGWIAAKAVTLTWLALAWSATAIKVGWQEGRKLPQPTS